MRGVADVPHARYCEQLLRADLLQQEASRLADELKKVRADLLDAIEAKDLAEHRAARAIGQKEAMYDLGCEHCPHCAERSEAVAGELQPPVRRLA